MIKDDKHWSISWDCVISSTIFLSFVPSVLTHIQYTYLMNHTLMTKCCWCVALQAHCVQFKCYKLPNLWVKSAQSFELIFLPTYRRKLHFYFSDRFSSQRLRMCFKVFNRKTGTLHLPEGEAMVGSKLRTIKNKNTGWEWGNLGMKTKLQPQEHERRERRGWPSPHQQTYDRLGKLTPSEKFMNTNAVQLLHCCVACLSC